MEGKLMANFSSLYNNNHILVGSIVAVSVDNVPYGFLECNGAEISRDTYADLYAVIGDTYGNGDGSTTFNIPDLRGEFLRGWDNDKGVDPDRNIGTWQRGTIFIAPDDHQLSSLVRTNDGNGVSDPYDGNGYYDNEKHNSTNLTDNGYKRDGSEDARWRHTRPRNIAIMYCIKY
jgi:phage-related tail fiber protein